MTKRLTAQDWIDFALKTLAREGFQALKADVLARKLGVSRGSFYWHFSELGAFHARVIEHWRQTATEAIIADLERYDSREQRLDVLLRGAFGHSGLVEVRMRGWAEQNAEAARVLSDIDRRRKAYIEQMLVVAGIMPPLAATRAQLLYWSYLGAALSRSKLTGRRLDRIVAELKRIGLGEIEPAAQERHYRRRLSKSYGIHAAARIAKIIQR
jgi:AcrR family transcriptional regulator